MARDRRPGEFHNGRVAGGIERDRDKMDAQQSKRVNCATVSAREVHLVSRCCSVWPFIMKRARRWPPTVHKFDSVLVIGALTSVAVHRDK